MIVRLSCEHPGGRALAGRLRERAAAYLRALGRRDAEISVLLVGDRRIRALNRKWRGKDRATDVLSFPLSDPPGIGPLLGDVVISTEIAARRARTEGRPIWKELERYLAHGILHLLGYDHERPGDARRMAAREAALVHDEGLVGAALRQTPARGTTSGGHGEMDPFADIDLDSESVWLDGAWYTRQDLARRIKDMIETGDFRVSRPSQALERLEAALAQARGVTVRMPAELVEAISGAAARLGRPVGHLVREAVAYYLAAAAAYGAAQAGTSGGAPPQPGLDVDIQVDADVVKKAR